MGSSHTLHVVYLILHVCLTHVRTSPCTPPKEQHASHLCPYHTCVPHYSDSVSGVSTPWSQCDQLPPPRPEEDPGGILAEATTCAVASLNFLRAIFLLREGLASMSGLREEQLPGDGDGACGRIQWAAVGVWGGASAPHPFPIASLLSNQPTCQPGGLQGAGIKAHAAVGLQGQTPAAAPSSCPSHTPLGGGWEPWGGQILSPKSAHP